MAVSALNQYSLRQWLEGPGAEKTAFWIAAIFLLLISYTLAEFTWSLFEDDKPNAPVKIEQTKSKVGTVAEGEDFSRLSDLHLFGKVVIAKVDPVQVKPKEKPKPVQNKPKINAKLIGILYSDNPDIARALISSGGGDEYPYRVDDLVENAAKVAEIHPDHVIIINGGSREKLVLPEDQLNLGSNDLSIHGGGSLNNSSNRNTNTRRSAINSRSSRNNNRNTRRAERNTRKKRNTQSNTRTSRVSKPTKSATELKSIRDDLVRNPAKISSLIRAFPYSDKSSGKFMGFRVTPGRDPALFHEIGLRSGDIVVNLNGVELDSPTKGLQIMGELATASSISATVLRNGNMETVFFNFQ